MQPTADFDAAGLARSLLRRRREGALATLQAGTGAPYCSLVNCASSPDGSPILLVSQLALHTQNMQSDPRVSLMLDERAPGDPLEGARIMVSGKALPADDNSVANLQQRYLAAHPTAEAFVGFKDFSFFQVRITGVHLVAGFGRIVDLTSAQVLTDIRGADELIAAEPDIRAHLNSDHQEALALYATRLCGTDPGEWRCTGCDPDGLDLWDEATRRTVRLDFSRRVKTPAALRQMLKRLARQAREIGENLE